MAQWRVALRRRKMTQWSPEQFIKVQMAGIEALTGLTGKAFEGFENCWS